ncbi:MAG: hypothetical protein IH987_15865 [Planctomycetes bacterium]|nr:hypothetical protein [Planctomycetota bacterium]
MWIADRAVGVDDRVWSDIAPQTTQGATTAQGTPVETGASFKIRARFENAGGSHGAWDESDDMFDVSVGDTIPTVGERDMMVMTLLALISGSSLFRQRRHGRSSNMPY